MLDNNKITDEELVERVGQDLLEYQSKCQIFMNVEFDDTKTWKEQICGEEAVAFLRMPGDIPHLPICPGHIVSVLIDDQWTYQMAVDEMAEMIMALDEGWNDDAS